VAFGRAFASLLSIAVSAGAAAIASPCPAPDRVAAAPLPKILFSQPAEGSSLHEGDTVQIRWSGVPADAEEIELLLSVDGGRQFSLRLTDALDSTSGSFLWRVPSLSTDTASLAIRMGVHGEEIVSAPGPLFRLSHSPSTPGALLRWRAGEIWMDSRDPDEPTPGDTRSASGLSTRPEQITSIPGGSDTVSLPRSAARLVTIVHESQRRALREADTPVAIGSSSRIPLSIPQRI
jgi:hypothetical protein